MTHWKSDQTFQFLGYAGVLGPIFGFKFRGSASIFLLQKLLGFKKGHEKVIK